MALCGTCLGIHYIRADINVGDVLAKLAAKFGLNRFEVQRLHTSSGTTVNSRLVTDNVRAQRLRESSNRLSEVTLEELDNGRREVELLSPLNHLLLGQRVRGHPLCKVTNDFRRWCDLASRVST